MARSEDFLKAFKDGYVKSSKVKNQYYRKWHPGSGKRLTRDWTTAMYEVFDIIANDLGFERISKELGHADLRWYKKDHSYAIEHENDYEGVLDEEVPKVLDRDANLKIVVTYVSERSPKEEAKIVDGVTEQIEEQKDKNFEFILLLGRRTWAKEPAREPWTAHVWTKQYVRSKVLLL